MALQTIQVADKPTLDLVSTNVQVLKDSINNQGTKIDGITAAKHAIWINDYKTYGQDSFVYNNKDIYHELCCSETALYDSAINGEALAYVDSIGEVGKLLSNISDSMINIDTVSNLISDNDSLLLTLNDGGGYESLIKYCLTSDSLMTELEGSTIFIDHMTSKAQKTIFGATPYNKEKQNRKLENVFLLNVKSAIAYYPDHKRDSTRTEINAIYHGQTSRTTIIQSYSKSGSSDYDFVTQVNKDVNRFVKLVESPSWVSSEWVTYDWKDGEYLYVKLPSNVN